MCWVIQERAREVSILKDLTGKTDQTQENKYIKLSKTVLSIVKETQASNNKARQYLLQINTLRQRWYKVKASVTRRNQLHRNIGKHILDRSK